ncbi:hypothetical protein NKG05_20870 [Oerskovia sp. M15]
MDRPNEHRTCGRDRAIVLTAIEKVSQHRLEVADRRLDDRQLMSGLCQDGVPCLVPTWETTTRPAAIASHAATP